MHDFSSVAMPTSLFRVLIKSRDLFRDTSSRWRDASTRASAIFLFFHTEQNITVLLRH